MDTQIFEQFSVDVRRKLVENNFVTAGRDTKPASYKT